MYQINKVTVIFIAHLFKKETADYKNCKQHFSNLQSTTYSNNTYSDLAMPLTITHVVYYVNILRMMRFIY